VGEHPIVAEGFRDYFASMKIEEKKVLPLSESLTAAYQLWGAGQDQEMMQLAIDAHLVLAREQPPIVISPKEGKSA
jgi:hypothetical protein